MSTVLKIFLIVSLFFVSADNSTSFDAADVYKKLISVSRLHEEKKSKWMFPENGHEFSISLSEYRDTSGSALAPIPGVKAESQWYYSYAQVFYKPGKKVKQISIITMACNFKIQDNFREPLQNQHSDEVRSVSQEVFGQKLDVTENHYKALGPHWNKRVRTSLSPSVVGVKNVKLLRDIYKCDGGSGFGFRTDFFL